MNALEIVVCMVILTVLLYVVFRQHNRIRLLEEKIEAEKRHCDEMMESYLAEREESNRLFTKLTESPMSIRVVEYLSRHEVCVVAELTGDQWAQCLIKTIPYNADEPGDREFARREAEELKEIIEKW